MTAQPETAGTMTDIEKIGRLADVGLAMKVVQAQAERIAGHVLALEEAGISLPKMKEVARMLAEIALGWESEAWAPKTTLTCC
jgi:hypothetical protein